MLATTSTDGTVRLWDSASGRTLATFANASKRPTFAPDGRRIAIEGTDGTVRIYNTTIEDVVALARSRVTRQLTPAEQLR